MNKGDINVENNFGEVLANLELLIDIDIFFILILDFYTSYE